MLLELLRRNCNSKADHLTFPHLTLHVNIMSRRTLLEIGLLQRMLLAVCVSSLICIGIYAVTG